MSESVKPAGGRRPFGDHLFDVYLTRSYHELHDEAFEMYCKRYADLDEDGKLDWIDNLYYYLNSCFLTENAGDAFSTMDCLRYEGDREMFGEYADYVKFLVDWFDQYWGHLSHELPFEDSLKAIGDLFRFAVEHELHVMAMMALNKMGNTFLRFKANDIAVFFYEMSLRYIMAHSQNLTKAGLGHVVGFPISNMVNSMSDVALRNRVISIMTSPFSPMDISTKEYLMDQIFYTLTQDKVDYVVGEYEGEHSCHSVAAKCYDYQYRLKYKSAYDPINKQVNKSEKRYEFKEFIDLLKENPALNGDPVAKLPPLRDFVNRIYTAYHSGIEPQTNERGKIVKQIVGAEAVRRVYRGLDPEYEQKINETQLWWMVGGEATETEYKRMERYLRDCGMITKYTDASIIFGHLTTKSKVKTITNYLDNILRTVTPMSYSEHGDMMPFLFTNPNLFYDKSALVSLFCSKAGAGSVYEYAIKMVELIRKTAGDSWMSGEWQAVMSDAIECSQIKGTFSDRQKEILTKALCARTSPSDILKLKIKDIITNMQTVKNCVGDLDKLKIDLNLIVWESSSSERTALVSEMTRLFKNRDLANKVLNDIWLFPDRTVQDVYQFYHDCLGYECNMPEVPMLTEIPEMQNLCLSVLSRAPYARELFKQLGFSELVNKILPIGIKEGLKYDTDYNKLVAAFNDYGWTIDETHVNANIIRIYAPDVSDPEKKSAVLMYICHAKGEYVPYESDAVWQSETMDKMISPVHKILRHKEDYAVDDLLCAPFVVLMPKVSLKNFSDASRYWQDVTIISSASLMHVLEEAKALEGQSLQERMQALKTKSSDLGGVSGVSDKTELLKKNEELPTIHEAIPFVPWDFFSILTAYRRGYDMVSNCSSISLGFLQLLDNVVRIIDQEGRNAKGLDRLSLVDRNVTLEFFLKEYNYQFTIHVKTVKQSGGVGLELLGFDISRLSDNELYVISGYKRDKTHEGYKLDKGANVFVGNICESKFEIVLRIDGTISASAGVSVRDRFRNQLSMFEKFMLEGLEESAIDFQKEKSHELAVSVAKAAIMSRNMSHNLGSHVMAYLKQGLKGEAGPSYLAGVGRFVSYLQERQDFIATIATDYIPYFSSVNFKDAIYDELNPDLRYLRHSERSGDRPENLLLKYIALSEGLSRSSDPEKKVDNQIFISFRRFNGLNDYENALDRVKGLPAPPAADLDAMREFNVCLPGGVVGRQAIFSIVENVIRNSAKHGNWREKKHLDIRFDLLDMDDLRKDEAMLKHLVEKGYISESGDNVYDFTTLSDYYIFTITDNLDIAPGAFASLEKSLEEGYVREDGEMINAHKGIKEIRISAAWLRGIGNDLHIKAGLPPVVTVRNLYPGLQYVFCLHKVKDVLVVTDKQTAALPADWNSRTLNAYLASADKSYNMIVVENEEDRARIEELSPDRVVVCPPDIWRKICGSGDCDFDEIRRKLYARCYGVQPDSPALYIVDGKVPKDNVVTGKVHLCGADIDVDPEKCKYVYRTHHRDEAEFMAFMDCPCYGDDVTVEGISGNDSTDRLLRNELIDDVWYYGHLAALRTETAVFDERLFSRVSGLKDEDLMRYSGLSRILSDKQTGLEEKKVKVCEFLGYKRMRQKQTIMSLDSLEDLAGALGINPDMTMDAGRLMLVYRQKKVSLCNVIYNPVEQVFDVFGCLGGRRAGDSYVSVISRIAVISRSQDMKGIEVVLCEGAERLGGLAEYISVHQGLMDKIYTKFGLRGSVASMCSVTAAIYAAFSSHAALYENVPAERFRRGFFVHSGRSKPSPSDMPQHQPFIQYAAIENAVLDCKYSLVELFKSARYE